MKPVSRQILQSRGAILISNINQGLEDYPHKILSMDREGYRQLIDKLIEANGWADSFVDFYYFKLTDVEQKKVLACLDQERQVVLGSFSAETNDVYFQLEEGDAKIIDILCELNALEALFSTFYFSGVPCTLWGNYGLKYPLIWGKDHVCVFP